MARYLPARKRQCFNRAKMKRSWTAPPKSHPPSPSKICKPEERASLIVFLARDEASFVTGATWRWTVASWPRTDSRQVERRGPPQRKACSARIGRRRSARCQASVQQDSPPLHHSHDGTWGRRRRPLRPVCSAPISGAPKAAGAKPAAGPPHPERTVRCTAKSGFDVSPGDLGENITTAGLDLETLPLNTQLRIGTSANIRLTGLRTPCVLIDRFKSGLKSRLLAETPNPPFRAGVMAVVSEGGEISPGDPIHAILSDHPHLPLPPL